MTRRKNRVAVAEKTIEVMDSPSPTPLTITIVQVRGREEYEWTISRRDEYILFEKEQHAPVKQLELSRKFLWQGNDATFLKFLHAYFMRILLENGALDTYKSQIILHGNCKPHPDGCLDGPDPENHVFSKQEWVDNIVISNAWANEKYQEYYAHKEEMDDAVADILTMFVYTNCGGGSVST